jgi:hypothetical protein
VKFDPAAAVRSLVGDLDSSFRPLVNTAVLLLSLLVIVSGFVANGWQWSVLGVAIGGPGVVLPYVGRRKDWSAKVTWVLLAFIVVLDLGVLSAIAGTPGT